MKKDSKSLIVSGFLCTIIAIGIIQERMLQKSIKVRVVEERVDDKILLIGLILLIFLKPLA